MEWVVEKVEAMGHHMDVADSEQDWVMSIMMQRQVAKSAQKMKEAHRILRALQD